MTPKETVRTDSSLWKDSYDLAAVRKLGETIKRINGSFDVDQFVTAARDGGLLSLELKSRINLTAAILKDFLPRSYSTATNILIKVAPHVGSFLNWTLTSYVEQFGLKEFEMSVSALKELTKFGTGEFAIRPFVNQDPNRALKVMHEWAEDENEHVRRLAAEGSRPLGVWVAHIEAFKENPRPVMELLEKMKADPSLYVRKAVANNLNDIAKHHPEMVIKTCARWKKDKRKETDWIIRHGCRGLIKTGRPEVFPLLGFTPDPQITVTPLKVTPKRIRIGDSVAIAFNIISRAKKTQRLAVDYVVHYVKSTGRVSPKVFKLTEKALKPGEILRVKKTHDLIERSTRKHFPGRHKVELMINGRPVTNAYFDLK